MATTAALTTAAVPGATTTVHLHAAIHLQHRHHAVQAPAIARPAAAEAALAEAVQAAEAEAVVHAAVAAVAEAAGVNIL